MQTIDPRAGARNVGSMRIFFAALLALVAVGCSVAAPAAPAQAEATIAPIEAPAPQSAPEPRSTTLTVDETFNHWDIEEIRQAVSEWCSFDPSLCLTVVVGPVIEGQKNSVLNVATGGCGSDGTSTTIEGREEEPTHQIKIWSDCPLKQWHATVWLVAVHEIGHWFGVDHHLAKANVIMNADVRHQSRCITYDDLAEVCSYWQCSAPRFDLVCLGAEAAASNPYTR